MESKVNEYGYERTCQVCGGFLASAKVGGFVCERCGRSQEKLNERRK